MISRAGLIVPKREGAAEVPAEPFFESFLCPLRRPGLPGPMEAGGADDSRRMRAATD
jgi:hypothetical protein